MNCLDEGTLQARQDGELSATERAAADQHLASCAACRTAAEALAARSEQVRRALISLAPGDGEVPPPDAGQALARFRAGHAGVPLESPSWLAALFARRWRPAWAAAALVAIIAALYSFAPARSWAQRVLAMLRVQKIAVVPVDTQLFPVGPAASGRMIGQFLSDNVVVTMSPGEPQTASDAASASQLAGYQVRLLANRTDAPLIKVEGEQAYQMTLNRDRLQSLLDELGRSDVQLPASIDGALVAVHIPKAVVALYGQCPDRSARNAQNPPQPADFASCVVLGQIPSPTVSVPPELNIQQLAEMGLEAAGMSPQEAQAFCQTVDWTSTLVLPLPRNGGSYTQVSVDGVQGTLISIRPFGDRPPKYALLWVKDGIVYSLAGAGSTDQAVSLGDSLQ